MTFADIRFVEIIGFVFIGVNMGVVCTSIMDSIKDRVPRLKKERYLWMFSLYLRLYSKHPSRFSLVTNKRWGIYDCFLPTRANSRMNYKSTCWCLPLELQIPLHGSNLC